MDPRIRQRRVAVTRGRGRRRLVVLAAALGVVLAGVGAWCLLHSSPFSARVLTVRGSVHTPAAQVLAAAGLERHPPLLDVDPGTAASAVARLPWVASATVARHWPDAVVVTVHERVPVGAVPLAPPARGVALVDVTGRVLADEPATPAGLPVLVVPPAAPAPGASLAPAADGALVVASSLPAAFRAQVRQVRAAAGGDGIELDLTTPITVDVGPATALRAKWEDVAAALAGATLHPGDVIDVSAPSSPVVTGP